MPSGGKRAGAGRPRKDDVDELWVSLPIETLNKLRAMIPRGHRSEFIRDCVETAIRTRELMDNAAGIEHNRETTDYGVDFYD